jgi:hypothetical protein
MCTSILEGLLPKVVNCKKAYFNTEYGTPSTQVFDPSSPEYEVSMSISVGRVIKSKYKVNGLIHLL